MKKIIMIAVMAVVALAARAQEYHITPHIGLGYAHMSNFYDKFTDGNSFVGGVEFEYMPCSKFGVSVGADYLLVLTEGTRTDTYIDDVEVHTTGNKYYTFSYFNLPVLAQYHMGQFALKAGLQPSFKIGGAKHNLNEDFFDPSSGMKSFNLSLPVGVSYEFKKTPIVLDLRCAIPLTRQNKFDAGDNNMKLLTVALTGGYRF